MNIQTYLADHSLSINAFADLRNIPATTVWRAMKSRPLRPKSALAIEEATGGAVTRMELLYPTHPKEAA